MFSLPKKMSRQDGRHNIFTGTQGLHTLLAHDFESKTFCFKDDYSKCQELDDDGAKKLDSCIVLKLIGKIGGGS